MLPIDVTPNVVGRLFHQADDEDEITIPRKESCFPWWKVTNLLTQWIEETSNLVSKGMPSQCFSLVLEAPWSLQSQVVSAGRVFLLVYDDVLILSAVGKTQASRRDGGSSTGMPPTRHEQAGS